MINSPLGPVSIFLGKLIGGLGFVFLLLILSLPAAAACYTMGGLDFYGQFLPLYILFLVIALEYTALGLVVSVSAQTPESAVRTVYIFVFILTLVPEIAYHFLHDFVAGPQAIFLSSGLEWIRSLSPLPPVMEILGNTTASTVSAAAGSDMAHKAIITSLVIAVVLALSTISRLNTKLLDRSRAAGKITDDRSQSVRVLRRLMYLWFFDPQRRSSLIGSWTNPVMVKEMRSRKFGRMGWLIRLAAAALVVSLALMLAVSSHKISATTNIGAVVVLLQMGLIILITPTLACGLISGERESNGWPLLQMTPLSAGRIVRGKLLSVAMPVLLILIGTLPAYAMMAYIAPATSPTVPGVIFTLFLTAVVAVLVSAAASSLCKKTSMATIVAFAVLIGLWGGTLLIREGENILFSPSFVERCLTINPVAAALSLAQESSFKEYHLTPINWWIMLGVCVLCSAILVWQTRRLTNPE